MAAEGACGSGQSAGGVSRVGLTTVGGDVKDAAQRQQRSKGGTAVQPAWAFGVNHHRAHASGRNARGAQGGLCGLRSLRRGMSNVNARVCRRDPVPPPVFVAGIVHLTEFNVSHEAFFQHF